MENINRILSGIFLPVLLFLLAGFFLFYLKGIPFRHLPKMLKGLSVGSNGVSPTRSVLMALAGTLGLGNIIGVADAVAKGGAGVLFWMWLSGLAAAVIKFAEIVLAISKRKNDQNGHFGGAMYYIFPKCAAVLFCFFCILCGFSVGNILQSAATAEVTEDLLSLPKFSVSFALFLLLLFTLFSKNKRLFSVASAAVPFATALYSILCLTVIVRNASALPTVFQRIFKEAFQINAVGWGAFFSGSTALRYGIIRGLLSNEAGCGTAPMAHAASSVRYSACQGALGVVEVGVDTHLLCTLTGVTLLLGEKPLDNPTAALLSVLKNGFGKITAPLLCISLFLFAFATMVCWSFYLDRCADFLSFKKCSSRVLRVLFLFSCLFAPFFPKDLLWKTADLSVAVMTMLNLCYLYIYRKDIKKEITSWKGQFLL